MKIQAKYVLGLIGLIVFGLPGGLIGFFIGSAIDQGLFGNFLSKLNARFFPNNTKSSVQHLFFVTTFQIMGYLAKADGKVSQREIQAAENIIERMGLTADQRELAIQYFNEGKQENFPFLAALQEMRKRCWMHPNLMKTFLDIQLQIAYADGGNLANRQALQNVCNALGLGNIDLSFYERTYRAEQAYSSGNQRQQESYYQSNRPSSVENAYALLGVSSSSTQAEVKKAYRRLMSQHHPDKLIAQGVPEAMIKLATEKTQKIQRAYEDIRAAKGW